MGNLLTRFRQRDVRIILLGLDSAGKTTILYRLKLDDTVTTVPTIGFNVENIRYKDLHLTAWDIGSRDKIRPLFRHYYKGADAVVFVIDSHDPERLDELNYDVIKPAVSAEELTNAVFLFLANKMDLPDTMSTEEISEKLGLRFLKHPWGILPVSAVNGEGLHAALDWLAIRLGSSQVKPRNFTTVQPKPKFLQQCRTESSLSSSSSTATSSKTDSSKPNAQAPAPPKPVIFVNSKLYTDVMTTPTVSSGSMDNASALSVSTPGSYYSACVPRRTPGSVMNTFSSYSIAQSMKEDNSRRKFSTISRSDIRKLSCASLVDDTGHRKNSVASMFESPTQRKMSSASLMDSPYRRKMSTSFVIDAPPYRKFSSASLMEAAYSRKLSATSLGDARLSDAGYQRKMSAASLGDRRVSVASNDRKLSMVSLGDSQEEPEKPKMSYLAATPVVVATPPTSKRKSEDFTLAGFGKFSSIMADYIQSGRKDSDTSGDSLNLASPSDPAQPDIQDLDLKKPPDVPDTFNYVRKSTEQMKEEHYNEMLSLLPESYTRTYCRDYFSIPMEKLHVEEDSQMVLSAIDEARSNLERRKSSGQNMKNVKLIKQFFKCSRQASADSDSSASSSNRKRSTFYLFCTSRKLQCASRKDGRLGPHASPSHKRAYCSRAYSAIRCLFSKPNKAETTRETNSATSNDDSRKAKGKKETRVSFDLQNHNIEVEVIDVTDDDVDERENENQITS